MMDGELLSLYPYPSDSGYRNKLCIRYLPTGPKGKPALWRRVAVLPCVQGQKVSKTGNLVMTEVFKLLIYCSTPSATHARVGREMGNLFGFRTSRRVWDKKNLFVKSKWSEINTGLHPLPA